MNAPCLTTRPCPKPRTLNQRAAFGRNAAGVLSSARRQLRHRHLQAGTSAGWHVGAVELAHAACGAMHVLSIPRLTRAASVVAERASSDLLRTNACRGGSGAACCGGGDACGGERPAIRQCAHRAGLYLTPVQALEQPTCALQRGFAAALAPTTRCIVAEPSGLWSDRREPTTYVGRPGDWLTSCRRRRLAETPLHCMCRLLAAQASTQELHGSCFLQRACKLPSSGARRHAVLPVVLASGAVAQPGEGGGGQGKDGAQHHLQRQPEALGAGGVGAGRGGGWRELNASNAGHRPCASPAPPAARPSSSHAARSATALDQRLSPLAPTHPPRRTSGSSCR